MKLKIIAFLLLTVCLAGSETQKRKEYPKLIAFEANSTEYNDYLKTVRKLQDSTTTETPATTTDATTTDAPATTTDATTTDVAATTDTTAATTGTTATTEEVIAAEDAEADTGATDTGAASTGAAKIKPNIKSYEGETTLYFIFFGLCYNISIISLVYRRYMIKCTEIIATLIGKKSLVLSPMLYSFFFSYPFFITSFFSYFIYDNHYAIYCILGSDAINITLLWGLCLYNTKLPFKIDKWYFGRDSFFYICQVTLLAWVANLSYVAWFWSGLQVLIYLLYFMNQRSNRQWKERIYKLIGLRHADDEFDSTPFREMSTKGYRLKDLKEEGFIEKNSEQLQRIINVYNGFIQLRNRRRRRIKTRFQKYVRTVIHAIHNKNMCEKQERIESFGQYLKDFFKQLKEKEEQDDSFGDASDNEEEDDEMISFDSDDGNNSDEDDEESRIRKLDHPNGKGKDKDKKKKDTEYQKSISRDLISMNSDMDNKTDDDEKIEYYNEYVMRPMPTCLGWINYFLYFPVNLILIIIFKDFHIVETQSPNKLAYYTIMSLIILTLLSYFLALWSAIMAASIPWLTVETIAFTIGAWGLQMHYVYYNRKLAKQQNENKQFAFIIYFRQVGLLKIGFGIGLMWFFLTIFNVTEISMKDTPYRFQIFFYLGLTIAHTVFISLCKCEVKNRKFIWVLLAMYLIYFVFWIVLDYMVQKGIV